MPGCLRPARQFVRHGRLARFVRCPVRWVGAGTTPILEKGIPMDRGLWSVFGFIITNLYCIYINTQHFRWICARLSWFHIPYRSFSRVCSPLLPILTCPHRPYSLSQSYGSCDTRSACRKSPNICRFPAGTARVYRFRCTSHKQTLRPHAVPTQPCLSAEERKSCSASWSCLETVPAAKPVYSTSSLEVSSP